MNNPVQIQLIEYLRTFPVQSEKKKGPIQDKSSEANQKARQAEASANAEEILLTFKKSKLTIQDVSLAAQELWTALGHATDQGTNLKAALDALGQSAGKYQAGIASLIGTQQTLHNVTVDIIKQVTKLEEAYGYINKTYGTTRATSGKVAEGFLKIAKSIDSNIGNVSAYSKILKDFIPLQIRQLTINDELSEDGANLSAAQLKKNKALNVGIREQKSNIENLFLTADALKKNLQVTDAATEGFLRYSTAYEGGGAEALLAVEDIAIAIGGINDKSIFMKQITEGIGQAAAATRIQYGQMAGKLELSVLKSRQLGISMADLSKTGENFLDIESSVGKELEYQLLTGNRLLTQDGESLTAKYRQATIEGDMNKQADLMKHMMETEGDTLRKNLFARQQMADLLGMSEESLSGMLEKQKFVSKYGLKADAFKLDATEFEKALKKSEKYQDATAAGQKEMREDIKKADFTTLTTAEQANQHLKNIESNTQLGALGKLGKTMSELFEETAKGDPDDETSKGTNELVENIGKVTKVLGNVGEPLIKALGAVDNIAFAAEKLQPVLQKLTNFFGKMTGTNLMSTISSTVIDELKNVKAITTANLNFESSNFTTIAKGADKETDLNDFIWRPGGGIQSFTSADTVIGMKPGGPIAQSMGGGNMNPEAFAKAFAAELKNLKIIVETPLGQENSLNRQAWA